MYSDFYEIPLPALRFEKVEETDTKVNDTEENDAFQIDHVRKMQESSETTKDDKRRKADSLAKNDTQRNSNASGTTSISAFKTTKPTTLTESKQRHLL